MSSNSHEPIYSQQDMDNVLFQLRKEAKEAEQARQLLWAVVDTVGGEVAIPYSYWLDNDPVKEMLMWDDPQTYKMHLRTRAVENV